MLIWRSHWTSSTRSESMVIGGADEGDDGDGRRDEVPDGVAFVGAAKSSQAYTGGVAGKKILEWTDRRGEYWRLRR